MTICARRDESGGGRWLATGFEPFLFSYITASHGMPEYTRPDHRYLICIPQMFLIYVIIVGLLHNYWRK